MTSQTVARPLDEAELRELSRYFYALKEVLRLRLLRLLAESDELTVSELADLMHISQPLLSWHLRRLRQANIVTVRREGRESFYALNREQVSAFQAELARLLDL